MISSKSKIVFGVCATFLLLIANANAQLTLRGQVADEAGEALSNVTVKISTARPRVGRGVL